MITGHVLNGSQRGEPESTGRGGPTNNGPPILADRKVDRRNMEANIADSSLFTQIDPEAIEKHCRRFDLSPEKKLMLAVLTDAIKTIRRPTRKVYCEYVGKKKPNKRRREIVSETLAWFLDPQEYWTFSFRHICDVLGLEPDYVRGGVLNPGFNRNPVGRPRKRRRSRVAEYSRHYVVKREAVGRDEYEKVRRV